MTVRRKNQADPTSILSTFRFLKEAAKLRGYLYSFVSLHLPHSSSGLVTLKLKVIHGQCSNYVSVDAFCGVWVCVCVCVLFHYYCYWFRFRLFSCCPFLELYVSSACDLSFICPYCRRCQISSDDGGPGSDVHMFLYSRRWCMEILQREKYTYGWMDKCTPKGSCAVTRSISAIRKTRDRYLIELSNMSFRSAAWW